MVNTSAALQSVGAIQHQERRDELPVCVAETETDLEENTFPPAEKKTNILVFWKKSVYFCDKVQMESHMIYASHHFYHKR